MIDRTESGCNGVPAASTPAAPDHTPSGVTTAAVIPLRLPWATHLSIAACSASAVCALRSPDPGGAHNAAELMVGDAAGVAVSLFEVVLHPAIPSDATTRATTVTRAGR